MSNLKIQGNASGTGTTTLQSGNTNSNLTLALPIADGTANQALVTDGAGVLSFASTGTGDVVGPASSVDSELALFNSTTGKLIKRASLTGLVKATSGVASAATAGTDYLAPPSGTAILKANSGGALANATAGTDYVAPSGALGTPSSGTLTNCTVDGTNPIGYRDLPAVGTKTSSYTLAVGDVGKYVQVGTSGSITIPDATFAEGDAISIFNNTSGNITITCTITTAYIAGTDADKATVTLATRGIATVLFISGTVCAITGNVS
jgi:hypothetical protein